MPFPNVTIQIAKDALPPIPRWRQDATAGSVITCSLSSTIGVNSYQWWLWRQEGSTAGGAGVEPINLGNAATVAITIDIRGTYIIWCLVNAGATDATIIRGGCAYLESIVDPAGRPLRKLGPFETDEDQSDPLIQQNDRKMENRWLSLLAAIGSGGAGGGVYPTVRIDINACGHSGNLTDQNHVIGEDNWDGDVIWLDPATTYPGYLTWVLEIVYEQAVGTPADFTFFNAVTGTPIATGVATVGAALQRAVLPVPMGAVDGTLRTDAPGFYSASIYVTSAAGGNVNVKSVTLIGVSPGSGTSLPPPTCGVASWDIDLVRYIFVDPVNGDDSRIGYLDAAAGTVFTAPQVLAVSVRTTHRINEIRPPVGAGRMCVVLIAANGTAAVDHLASSDGLGMEDRRLCFGYSLLHTRGSDLTNSVDDRSQLGFITDATLAGPGATGEWTVKTVTSLADGVSIALVDCTAIPAGADITRYRLRCQHSGGAFFYLAPRWSAIDSDDTDTVVVWLTADGLAPGDSVWIETEGVLLNSCHEAASYAADETSSAPASFIAGIHLSGTSGQAVLGCADDPRTPTNCTGVQADGGFSGVGSLVSAVQYTDEVGVVRGSFLGPGLSAPTGQFDGYVCDLTGASIYGGPTANIRATRISAYLATLRDMLLFSGEQMLSVSTCNYGQVTLTPATEATLATCRSITDWSPLLKVQPLFGAAFVCQALADLHNLRLVAEGSEPDSPAITLKAGHYAVLFDHGDIGAPALSAGNGVRIEYDAAGTKFTPLTWASLQTTGFEIEGLQKVMCKMTGANYYEDMLPCPRGRVMQLPDYSPG